MTLFDPILKRRHERVVQDMAGPMSAALFRYSSRKLMALVVPDAPIAIKVAVVNLKQRGYACQALIIG